MLTAMICAGAVTGRYVYRVGWSQYHQTNF
jgi:hypothetical protein